jgi:hypothetical protein
LFLCHSKIRALQDLDTSNEEKIKDLESNLDETNKKVKILFKFWKILENSNTDLKINLDETTKKDFSKTLLFKLDLI